MNYYLHNSRVLLLLFMLFFSYTAFSQEINVDVNLNIIHSVEGVSDFGRERHKIVHFAYL
ncbi:hypothetical protein EI427_25445 [Flammeovirga pectinis]|uniref:Uncharacterized protein n=1 Tax=Flammeovirga pectinis TaxID=2494373 RepID=A0A3Q9FRQ6_9BACT|nr:hypothetical protein [Flammeovirga pectinis]AZQ65561.1 hypothetical protein EI427_25445 [Flammeovirga pectinis]